MNYSEDEILDFINDYIIENHGNPISFDDKILSSGIDSFSGIMMYVELDDKYHCFDTSDLNKEKFDYSNQTPNTIYERIVSCM
jgi:hypothetical protein